MKKTTLILSLILAGFLSGCQTFKTQKETRESALPVMDAFLEKQIGQLKFCEAIFENDFHIFATEEEKILQAKRCKNLWWMSEEELENYTKDNDPSSLKFTEYLNFSKKLAKDKGWYERSFSMSSKGFTLETNYLIKQNDCFMAFLYERNKYADIQSDCYENYGKFYLFNRTNSIYF